jgi:hypothetical protein
MKTLKITLVFALFSTKIFAQFDGDEKHYLKLKENYMESMKKKVDHINEIYSARYVDPGKMDVVLAEMKDTMLLGMSIRACDENIRRIKQWTKK